MIIEENSIQLPQHPAYHTIGLSYLMKEVGTADGRQDDVSRVSIDRIRRQYLAIRAEGCLRPTLEKEESSMCFEDRIAGDDSYVFLSVREKDWTSLPGQACFGFIFDAYSLIDKGAILRTSDLVGKYTDILKELVAEQIGWDSVSTSSAEEVAKFKDEYLRLLDAVRATNETVQGVHEILHLFGQKVREIQQHRSEEHTSELQSHSDLVCRLLLEKKKTTQHNPEFTTARMATRHSA